MEIITVNSAALQTALVTFVGAQGSKLINDLYTLLDNAESAGFKAGAEAQAELQQDTVDTAFERGVAQGYSEGEEDSLAERDFSDTYDHGYDQGYQDGQTGGWNDGYDEGARVSRGGAVQPLLNTQTLTYQVPVVGHPIMCEPVFGEPAPFPAMYGGEDPNARNKCADASLN